MKFCPTCETRYDEEILRFCTKDGTPLIDDQPQFTELPSEAATAAAADDENEDDFGEETVIRRDSPPLNPPAFEPVKDENSPRIVIPMRAEERAEQQVRSKAVVYQEAQPAKSNTPMIILTTVLLTLMVLAGMVGLFYALSDKNSSNTNANVNTNPPDMNMNVNLDIGNSPANFDYNINTNLNTNIDTNLNLNTNINVNIKTPTPTATRTPTPSPTETPSDNTNTNATPRTTPTPTATRAPTSTPPPPALPTTPDATPRTNPTSSPTVRLPVGNVSLPKSPKINQGTISIKPPISLPQP